MKSFSFDEKLLKCNWTAIFIEWNFTEMENYLIQWKSS